MREVSGIARNGSSGLPLREAHSHRGALKMTQHLPRGRLTRAGIDSAPCTDRCARQTYKGGLYALPPNARILNAIIHGAGVTREA